MNQFLLLLFRFRLRKAALGLEGIDVLGILALGSYYLPIYCLVSLFFS